MNVHSDIAVPSDLGGRERLSGRDGRSKHRDLLEAGVVLHEYQGLVLHAEAAVVDGMWTAVGSSNLDWRSTVRNNEIDAIIPGTPTGDQMEEAFRDDVAASKTVTLRQWRYRELIERLREVKAKLVVEPS